MAARDEARSSSSDELLAFVVLLLVAGNETTTNLIGNGLLALARNPAQYQRLRREPALIPSAIEEMLRYDSPVQMLLPLRAARHGSGRTRIEAGAVVAVIFGAANRDPAEIPGAGAVRRRARAERSPGVWRRHPLLYRRAAGAVGGADRVRGDSGAIRDYRAGRAVGAAVVSGIVRHARPARVAAERRLSITPALPAFRSCRRAPAPRATSARSSATRGPGCAKRPGR